jgi:1,4-alpha-glucan branching enzyme
LGRCLTEGFAYQGETSLYREGKCRGESCADLPPTAFVSFLQNHDQVGNRALGERLSSLCAPEARRAATRGISEIR